MALTQSLVFRFALRGGPLQHDATGGHGLAQRLQLVATRVTAERGTALPDRNPSAVADRARKFGRETVGHVRALLHSAGVLSRDGLTFPDFLGIGAQKAGTSWLHANLRRHPQVFMPRRKELHYFDWRPHRSLKTYAREFAGGEALVKGEITPYSAALPSWTIRYIHELMPDAKLILILRNPIDRAWSQAVMNLVVRAGRNFEEVGDDEFERHLRHPRTFTRGDYLGMIDNWLSVFPEERLLIGFFEEVRDRPQRLLSAVFDHIGVSTDVDWASFPFNKVVHAGVRAPLPPHFRAMLEEVYADEIERIADRCGSFAETWRCK